MAGFVPAGMMGSSLGSNVFGVERVGVPLHRTCAAAIGRGGGPRNFSPTTSISEFSAYSKANGNKSQNQPPNRNRARRRQEQPQQRGENCSPLGSLALGKPNGVGGDRERRGETSSSPSSSSSSSSSTHDPLTPLRNQIVQRDVHAAAVRSYDDSVKSRRELEKRKKEAEMMQRELALKMLAAQTSWVPRPSSKIRKPTSEHDVAASPPMASTVAPELPTPSSLNRRSRATKELIFRENDMSGNAFAQRSFVGYGWTNVWEEAWARGQWLLTLLLVQSSSSVVLQEYSELVQNNIVITLFLTMLVGSGGNVGNQSAIRVIRGLATGEMVVTRACVAKTMWQQTRVGLILATMLSTGGFLRVLLTEIDGVGNAVEEDYVNGVGDNVVAAVGDAAGLSVVTVGGTSSSTLPLPGGGGAGVEDMVTGVAMMTQDVVANQSPQAAGVVEAVEVGVKVGVEVGHPTALVGATGIAMSLFAIVTISTMVGTAVPFALAASGQDPANSGTSIQIMMDIAGVIITCVVCTSVFTHVVPVVAPVVTSVVAS